MQMKVCKQCGQMVQDTEAFCPRCGSNKLVGDDGNRAMNRVPRVANRPTQHTLGNQTQASEPNRVRQIQEAPAGYRNPNAIIKNPNQAIRTEKKVEPSKQVNTGNNMDFSEMEQVLDKKGMFSKERMKKSKDADKATNKNTGNTSENPWELNNEFIEDEVDEIESDEVSSIDEDIVSEGKKVGLFSKGKKKEKSTKKHKEPKASKTTKAPKKVKETVVKEVQEEKIKVTKSRTPKVLPKEGEVQVTTVGQWLLLLFLLCIPILNIVIIVNGIRSDKYDETMKNYFKAYIVIAIIMAVISAISLSVLSNMLSALMF